MSRADSPKWLRSFLREHGKSFVWLPLATCAVIALFAPLNVLDYEFPRWLVRLAGSVVPMVSRLNAEFELSQVAQLYYTTLWLLLPLSYWSMNVGSEEQLAQRMRGRKRRLWWPIAFFGLVWFGLLYMFNYEMPDPANNGKYESLMLHSRIGMAVVGGLLMMSLVVLPKLVIQSLRCYLQLAKEERLG